SESQRGSKSRLSASTMPATRAVSAFVICPPGSPNVPKLLHAVLLPELVRGEHEVPLGERRQRHHLLAGEDARIERAEVVRVSLVTSRADEFDQRIRVWHRVALPLVRLVVRKTQPPNHTPSFRFHSLLPSRRIEPAAVIEVIPLPRSEVSVRVGSWRRQHVRRTRLSATVPAPAENAILGAHLGVHAPPCPEWSPAVVARLRCGLRAVELRLVGA